MKILITVLSIASTISLNVMAKYNTVGSYLSFHKIMEKMYFPANFSKVTIKITKWYCFTVIALAPPSNCLLRFEARKEGEDIVVPQKEGISDDPQSGDDRNPGIPPTEGVEDDALNNNK